MKWFGNLWLSLDYDYQKENISKEKSSGFSGETNYRKTGIICPSVGSKSTSFRLNTDSIFSNADLGIYQTDKSKDIPVLSVLGYLNSKVVQYVNNMLNPTVNIMPNDLKRIPFTRPKSSDEQKIDRIVSICVTIKKYICTFAIINPNYESSPILLSSVSKFEYRIKSFFNYENHLLTQVFLNESIINEKIFEIYDLTSADKVMVLAKEGECIGGLPVSAKARAAYLGEEDTTKEFPLDNIRDFIETLPVKEFSAEEREVIESEFPSLYQSNNDLEEFCIRHQVNPINIWYWFKQSNVIPKQRMNALSMEFLADMIREILMEDEDGIIPLVGGAGEQILLDRIEEKFREKGFSMAQYSGFDTVLGRPLNEYINNYFFAELSDHLNLFMYLPKTPFIWHLSSGPEQGFDCYLIIYKWSRDNLMRLRSVYIEHRERALINRQSDLASSDSADAQNEKERIFKQLKEIESFKVKIDELLAEGYNPILYDGVGKNIAPLQNKDMIPYEVLNAGQLNKYLNADW